MFFMFKRLPRNSNIMRANQQLSMNLRNLSSTTNLDLMEFSDLSHKDIFIHETLSKRTLKQRFDPTDYTVEYNDIDLVSELNFAKDCIAIVDSNSEYQRYSEIFSLWIELLEHKVNTVFPNVKIEKFNFKQPTILPQQEPTIFELFKKTYPKIDFSYFDGKTNPNIDLLTVRKHTRGSLINYLKPKHLSINIIDKHTFVAGVVDLFDSLNLLLVDPEYKTINQSINEANLQASSCFPLFVKKSDHNAQVEVFDFIHRLRDLEEDQILSHMMSQPSTVFYRLSPKVKIQDSTLLTKVRLVFGHPFSLIILAETMFGDSLDKILQTKPFTVGLNRPQISHLVDEIRCLAFNRDENILEIDIQSIDMNLCSSLNYLWFAVLLFVNRFHLTSQDKVIAMNLFYYENFGPIRSKAINHIVCSSGGTKSGTRFNTFLNSMTLGLALNYLLLTSSSLVQSDLYLVQGDDSIMSVSKDIDIHIVRKCLSLFNLSIHPDKTFIKTPNQSIHFLGFDWTFPSNFPTNSLDWVFKKLVYPEKLLNLPFVERALLRSCSILFQLYDGLMYFQDIFLNNVKEIRKRLEEDVDVIIDLSSLPRAPPNAVIPFRTLVEQNWRLF